MRFLIFLLCCSFVSVQLIAEETKPTTESTPIIAPVQSEQKDQPKESDSKADTETIETVSNNPELVLRVRPDTWAKQVIGSELENMYKLDKDVYRSEQPDEDGMLILQKYGIKSVLNLRDHHDDKDEAEGTTIKLYRIEMNAGSISKEQLIQALRIIHVAPKPIAIHCWHGSDRTGCVAAAYRVVFQGWDKKDAIDELRNGGYGYHATFYKNIPKLIDDLDVEATKKAVLQGLEK